MNQTANTAKKRTWQPIRTGALIFGLAIAVGACQRDAADETAPGTPMMPGTTDERGAQPVRDVDSIIGAADRATNVNRQAELTNIEVQQALNDRVFWVGSTAERTVPVYLDDEAHKALISAQEKIEVNDRVTLAGEIKRTPSKDDLVNNWKLTAEDAEKLNRAQVYIHVRRVALAAEPAQPGQPGQPSGQPGDQPAQPGQPQPGQPGDQPAQPGQPQPGQPGQTQPGQPGQQPGQPQPGQQPGQPGQQPGQRQPGQQPQPGQTP